MVINFRYKTFIHLIILFLGILVFSSCKSSSLIRPGDSVNVAFDKAMAMYEKEKYSQAAEAFETVTKIARGTNFARDAQFYLAESYFNDRRYLLAASEYDRFIAFYPTDPRREEIDFKTALSFYKMSPRYRLDQSETVKALELLQVFTNRYPDSDRVLEASGYIDELRNKLAHKHINGADFYARINDFRAAAVYYELTFDRYPESDYAEEALFKVVMSYVNYAKRSVESKQIERYEKALENYDTFIQLFPQSERRKELEELRGEALKGIREVRGNTENTVASGR